MGFIQTSVLFSFILFAFSSISQSEDRRIVSSYYEFEKGSTEYLYGDNVVFRSEPSSSSKAFDTLFIGSEIEIVRKMDETSSLNGLDWNWYKVKVGRKTGYIHGGLIALDRLQQDDCIYLVTIAGVAQSSGDYEYIDYRVRTRVIRADSEYYGHESKLNTNSFYIESFGNRGLEGVDNMLRINLYAEACGVDGGQIYLFNDGDQLKEAIRLSVVSDAGVFWYSETVVFPEDEDGWEGIVQYEREYGVPMDEEYNWTKATVHNISLRWENGQFTPNIQKFEFEDGE